MNYYLNRKSKNNSFDLRNNIYNQRVDNNETRQFREIHNPIKNTEHITYEITDAQGLERAYADGNYYIHGDTKDWYDDMTKIPVWGDLTNLTRYTAAHDALMKNPQVKTIIGHSLGEV